MGTNNRQGAALHSHHALLFLSYYYYSLIGKIAQLESLDPIINFDGDSVELQG